jgi:hypothetical protein
VSFLIDKFPRLADTVESWNRSPNLWLRRASAVSFAKPAGKGRYLEHAYRIVTVLMPDSHDLIHKACGWLLREAGKADAARLERYLEHGPAIPRTTVRYAIERFPESKRQRILQITRTAGAKHGSAAWKGNRTYDEMDFRTGTYRRRVPRAPHDGYLGAWALQECQREHGI